MSTAPTAILLEPDAAEALAELYRAAIATLPPCAGRDDFISENPTAQKYAASICSGCSIFDLCADYARIARPNADVWAGRARRGSAHRVRPSQPKELVSNDLAV